VTDPAPGAGREPGPSVEKAITDLERLRELLMRAGRGEVEAVELRQSLESYWRTNGATLTDAAWSLADQVRLQALQALYKWRAQLVQQLQAQRTSRTPRRDEPLDGAS
jgi:hypothetical protein